MTSSATTATGTKPTLHTGDRMSPEEFDRIYADLHDVRAELIDGVVYVASPVRIDLHGEAHHDLALLIGTYRARTPGTRSFIDGSYDTPGGARVQLDLCLYRDGGAASVAATGFLVGVPEFIAEIASSSADYDLREKLRLYERTGVSEYLVWRTADGAIDFFRLQNGGYIRVKPDNAGVIESSSFPGLRLNVVALVRGEVTAALATLEAGARQ